MAAKKDSPHSIFPTWLRKVATFLWGPGRSLTAVVMLLAVFLIGWAVLWANPDLRGRILASDQYVVTQHKVDITPLPAWIHTDVRAEVFRNASLDGSLSVLDEDLNRRIAAAFALHPWVAKVQGVRKYSPARVEVELVYRKPVCMVEVPGDLLPVDVEGVLLPLGDFSPIEKQSYPCLTGIDTRPMGPVGQRWGDGRVVDAAEIAAAIGPAWQQLRLFRIVPSAAANPAATEATYEVLTRAGTRIFWGRGPSTTTIGEIPAVEKVARLVQYAAEHRSLDGAGGPQRLDVRSLPAAKAKP